MLELSLATHSGSPLRILCAGAHCDDIEVGCAGALLELQRAGRVATIDWVILCATPERQAESHRAMEMLIGPDVRGDLIVGDFEDGHLPAQYGPVKRFFESLKERPTPDLIFTHEREDRHQDHRLCNEMTWNTFRDHLVLEYEIPKWDGGLGQPGFYIPLRTDSAKRKVDGLLEAYTSQHQRDWFRRETFEAMLRLRGLECRSPSGLAEAFHARKVRFAGAFQE